MDRVVVLAARGAIKAAGKEVAHQAKDCKQELAMMLLVVNHNALQMQHVQQHALQETELVQEL